MRKWIALWAALLMLSALPVALAEESEDRVLTATGSAQVMIEPDYATAVLGISSYSETVAAAQAQNATQMTALLEALEKAGVAKENIQTSHFSVYPVYSSDHASLSYPQSEGEATGYRVENSVQVTLRDLSGIGRILDAAVEAGANQNYGISFDSTKRGEAYDKALQEAVKEAQRKAGLMAQAAGCQLGVLEELVEQGGGYGGGVYMKSMMDTAASTPIMSGTLTVEATVLVTYRLP